MSIHVAFGSSNIQWKRSLQNGNEDLHLVCTAVFGYLKPLHQELKAEQEKVWCELVLKQSSITYGTNKDVFRLKTIQNSCTNNPISIFWEVNQEAHLKIVSVLIKFFKLLSECK